jgi:dTDP-4-dehydrorhamnose reductase
MIEQEKLLFTGGSGLLGRELKKLLPSALFPDSREFDVTHFDKMDRFVSVKKISLIFHAAAFTSPPKIDQNPLRAIEVNIIGAANVVKLCLKHNIRLIYVSTDYVFKGDKGSYNEEDPVFPVNKYAWSKLGGECAVRLYENSLIIRTSFGPNTFPYEKAFIDQWTSRESVSVIARKMVALIKTNLTGTIHIGGPRRTVYEYAKSLDPQKEIKELSIREVNFVVPQDTSLNCEKYEIIMNNPKLKT